MINGSTSVWLGITFVLIGAMNVWLVLQASARVRGRKSQYPVNRRPASVAISGAMIHLTLAMVLSPLIFVKVLVARYYKSYYSLLLPIWPWRLYGSRIYGEFHVLREPVGWTTVIMAKSVHSAT